MNKYLITTNGGCETEFRVGGPDNNPKYTQWNCDVVVGTFHARNRIEARQQARLYILTTWGIEKEYTPFIQIHKLSAETKKAAR